MDPSEEQMVAEISQHLEQASILVQQKKLERAIEILTRDLALARNRLVPRHGLYGSLVVNLADCHLTLKNYAISERLVLEYLGQLGEDGDERILDNCRSLLANIYMRTFRLKEAETMLLKSIAERTARVGELFPSQIPEHYLLLLSYLSSGRVKEAKALLPRLAQMRSNIPPGYEECEGLAAMVGEAFDLLGIPADQSQADPSPLSIPAQRRDDRTFYEGEGRCWRDFVDRKFGDAARAALELLVERATLRLLEIRLISLLWVGASVERDAEKALAVVPANSWERALVEFTLGRISFDQC